MHRKAYLEQLYRTYNTKKHLHCDPVCFLHRYPDPADCEAVALIASCLAYGRVAQILRSVTSVLDQMGPSPSAFLCKSRPADIRRRFAGFKHRFTTGDDLSALLAGMRAVIKRYGSLHGCFSRQLAGCKHEPTRAAGGFVRELRSAAGPFSSHLLPSPERGSACKRLNLFLRWMVRCDEVDPGGWHGMSPSLLIVPLDTHMFAIGRALGFTRRKQPDLKAALDITAGFRRLSPEDPVKYDFSLTRFGIHAELDIEEIIDSLTCRHQRVIINKNGAGEPDGSPAPFLGSTQ